MNSDHIVRGVLKPLIFIAALAPACGLVWAFFTDHLSANPLGDITNTTGDRAAFSLHDAGGNALATSQRLE